MLREIAARPWLAGLFIAAAWALTGSDSARGQGFFEPVGPAAPQAPVVKATAEFTAPAAGKPGQLIVTAEMSPGWHIYSITQAPGGPTRTQIKTKLPAGVTIGTFAPTTPPHLEATSEFGIPVESHDGKVTWQAPLELAAGVDPASLEITGSVFAQACSDACIMPQDYKFAARLKGTAAGAATNSAQQPPINAPPPANVAPPSAAPPGVAPLKISGLSNLDQFTVPTAGPPPADVYRPKLAKVHWQGRLEPATVAPGGVAKLYLTATPQEGWHVYEARNALLSDSGNQATSLVYSETAGFKTTPLATAQQANAEHLGESASLPYFEVPVTWTSDIRVPADAKPGTYRIEGSIGFQTCLETNCLNPEAVKIAATLTVADAAGGTVASGSQKIQFVEPMLHREHAAAFNAWMTDYLTSTSGNFDVAQLKTSAVDSRSSSLPWMLLTALLAGLILNVMPCVLPVIGLKVLSFIEQSHHDRRRVFLLNFWYSLGMISIFWVLAGTVIGLRLFADKTFGWGEQFSFDGFKITLVAVVFVMALSFLGVWEIPIPGFASGKSAQKVSSQEGFFGAFCKGAVTTVLATPCSGPFLGTAVAFALRESAPVTLAVFTAMGLGMALPYLVIGVKPALVKFLPKPGEWMDTFKQVMGFVLLGTVIWLMVPINEGKLLSTVTLLAGLGAACWWIGRTPVYAETRQKLRAWAGATAFGGLVGWLAFAMPQINDPLQWRPFTMAEFTHELNSGKTVMLEFTAKWCATCKTLKAANLDRTKTKELVNRNGVVVFEADIDHMTDEERAFFHKLQPSKAVPLVVIFSPERKYEPIPFGEGYTQSQILAALEEAGPSKKPTEVSMR